MVRSPRSFVLGAALAALTAMACSSGTEPPKATTIAIARSGGTGAFTMTSLGQTVQLTAKVLDQHGDSMFGQPVTWSSTDQTIATVGTSGLVTAVANGSANISAQSGDATGNVAATVGQVAASIQKLAGDAQIGLVGDTLATRLQVKILDALGHPIPNASVAWAVTAGGGAVAGSNADASGQASAKWTLGTAANPGAAVTATVGLVVGTFTAIQQAGPATQITVVTGNGQSATVNTAVSVDPKVMVADAFGNPKSGVTVHWSTVGGRGSVSPASGNTDASGQAAVTTWTMGGVGGTDTLLATFTSGPTATFTATVTVAGAATTVAKALGDNQTGLQTYALNVRPAVRVSDATNQPVAGATVTFAVASGGGSSSGNTAITDANGIAQVGSWTVQSGTNTLTASSGALAAATFTATGVAPSFNITIQNIGPPLRQEVQDAFDSAVAHWQRVIYADLQDISIPTPTGICGGAYTIPGGTIIDDIIILAKIDTIDGPGQILGQAGPCNIRTTDATSITGIMQFDSADVATLISLGNIDEVILHEMGHVLGIGTTWNVSTSGGYSRVCRQNSVQTFPGDGSVDTYYNCPAGLAAFDSIGGTSYTGGNKVPVENTGGGGTANGHWREATFGNELMTGFLNSGGANPLSLLTIASLQDELYTVNFAAAETYNHVFTAPVVATGHVIHMTNDIWRGPIGVMDASGRVLRVLQPR